MQSVSKDCLKPKKVSNINQAVNRAYLERVFDFNISYVSANMIIRVRGEQNLDDSDKCQSF